jgi:hypothetical protein
MADPSSSDDVGHRIWRFVRPLVLGRTGEASLRDQIEEAIDEHEGGDAPDGGGHDLLARVHAPPRL